tara:strand:- start:785 stop:973 length:189 start_codon:yes stop_codon:yes gene_type:complete
LRDFLSGACVKADAATLFIALEDDGLFKILDALEATAFDVFSFLAIFFVPNWLRELTRRQHS